jgi:hypothetical protein
MIMLNAPLTVAQALYSQRSQTVPLLITSLLREEVPKPEVNEHEILTNALDLALVVKPNERFVILMLPNCVSLAIMGNRLKRPGLQLEFVA